MSQNERFASKWSRASAALEDPTPENDLALQRLVLEYWKAIYTSLRNSYPLKETMVSSFGAFLACLPFYRNRFQECSVRGSWRVWLWTVLRSYRSGYRPLTEPAEQAIASDLAESFAAFETALAPVLEHGWDPEKLFLRYWVEELERTAWGVLTERWRSSGKTCALDPLFSFRAKQPADSEAALLAGTLNLSVRETLSAVSRLQRLLRDALREAIQDTLLRPEDWESEWEILFPEAVRTVSHRVSAPGIATSRWALSTVRRAVAYFYCACGSNTFWRWDHDTRGILWADGSTVATRNELVGILRRLRAGGLPPFGAIVQLLAALPGQTDLPRLDGRGHPC